jgi:hypothetical protein
MGKVFAFVGIVIDDKHAPRERKGRGVLMFKRSEVHAWSAIM